MFLFVLLVLGAIALWYGWQPVKLSPYTPIEVRRLFVWLNVGATWVGRLRGRPLPALDTDEIETLLRPVKEQEAQLYGSPNTPSEYQALHGLFDAVDGYLSPVGRLAWQREYRERVQSRQKMIDYVKAHPEVKDYQIERPLIISGLPRSGTTFMQRLLAADPRVRSPHLWLMLVDPSPSPPTREVLESGTDPRLIALQKARNGGLRRHLVIDYEANLNRFHFVDLTEVDEELRLLWNCMWRNYGLTYPAPGSAFERWVLDPTQDKSYIYNYVKTWVQVVSSTYRPESHWVLKTPSHTFFLPTVAETFPDANMVFLHRDPRRVVASSCKMNIVSMMHRLDFGKVEPHLHGERVLHALKLGTEQIAQFADGDNPVGRRAYHVVYEDFVADPLGMAEKIYDHFGYEMTDDVRQSMQAYLGRNRQHKHGKPNYSLEEFGLTNEIVDATFADYMARFWRKERTPA